MSLQHRSPSPTPPPLPPRPPQLLSAVSALLRGWGYQGRAAAQADVNGGCSSKPRAKGADPARALRVPKKTAGAAAACFAPAGPLAAGGGAA